MLLEMGSSPGPSHEHLGGGDPASAQNGPGEETIQDVLHLRQTPGKRGGGYPAQ